MMKMMRSKRKKKGFTLIELIVVIAILGILAAIAIPRFAGIQRDAAIKSDAATAEQMINAARIYEAQKNDVPGSSDLTEIGSLMTVPANTKSGNKGAFTLSYNSTSKEYEVSWGTGAKYTEGGALTEPTE